MDERGRHNPGHGWESERNDSGTNVRNVSRETTKGKQENGRKDAGRKGSRRNDTEKTILVTYQWIEAIQCSSHKNTVNQGFPVI